MAAPDSPRLEVLAVPDCPHAEEAWERVVRVAERMAPSAEPRIRIVRTSEKAEELDFPGSPTVRVHDEDVALEPPASPALACRTYGEGGAPPEWMIEAALVRASHPRHVLFLCVANSARSQMAEGIARSLASDGPRISSAGSDPTQVRDEAVQVLAEIGVDLRGHRSKGVDEVERPVDVVITLCAKEVCPGWLGDAVRLRWALPDPAAVGGDVEERLDAFRAVRDELDHRIRHLVAR